MVPTDSQAFDLYARDCGALPAAFVIASRLLLERAASPELLRPVRLGDRLRWLDFQSTTCNASSSSRSSSR